jgi:hypothetical protein
MKASSGIAALAAAALLSGTASATQIVVGKSRLVIDVEFWGRERITSPDPAGSNNDIITYGDPVHGTFRIFADDAPPARNSTGLSLEGKIYGDDRGGQAPTGAAFVTSRWLSPFPTGPVGDITHQVSSFPGSVPNDYVVVGDDVQINGRKDWFRVSDQFSPSSPDDRLSGETLTISVTSSLDFLDGFGLDQQFELNDLQEKEDTFASGFFRAKLATTETAVAFFDFAIDRLRVTPRVCKP